MEDGARFGLFGLMAIATMVGVVAAVLAVRSGHTNRPEGLALIVLAVAAGIAAGEADTLRGFVLLLTAPIGAYKVARIIVEPIAIRLRRHAS